MAIWLRRTVVAAAAAIAIADVVGADGGAPRRRSERDRPERCAAFKTLISTLTSNWEWLIGTGVGLVLVLIAGLMIAGSQRAPDHLFRVIGGIMLILIVIPAVLA